MTSRSVTLRKTKIFEVNIPLMTETGEQSPTSIGVVVSEEDLQGVEGALQGLNLGEGEGLTFENHLPPIVTAIIASVTAPPSSRDVATTWLANNPHFLLSVEDFSTDILPDQDPLEVFTILVQPGASRVEVEARDTFYAGRLYSGGWVRLEISPDGSRHSDFLYGELALLTEVVDHPTTCIWYKLECLASRLSNFRMDLAAYIKKHPTCILTAMPAVLDVVNCCKRLLALGDVRLSRYSHFPAFRMTKIEDGSYDNFYVLPEEEEVEEEEEGEAGGEAEGEQLSEEEEDYEEEEEEEFEHVEDSRILTTQKIVHESTTILQILLAPDERFKNSETRFNLFTQLFLPIASRLPTPAVTYKFSNLFNVDEWKEQKHQVAVVHPISCKSLIHLVHSCMTWFKNFLCHKESSVVGPDFLPGDRVAIIQESLNISMMMLEQHFIPEIQATPTYHDSNTAASTISVQAADLFTSCLKLCPWLGSDAAGQREEYGMIIDNLHSADLKYGNLPSASLIPFGAIFELGLCTPTIVPYAFNPVSITDLNNYASVLCSRMCIKLKRPLKHYLRDYQLPTHFAMLYALITILERYAEEAGDPALYVHYVECDMLTKGFEVMGPMFVNHPASFLNAIEPILDVAATMVNRLVGRRYQEEIFNNTNKEHPHPVCHTGFFMCFYGVQHAIRALESALATGIEIHNIDISNIVSKLLDLGKNLDRVAHPQLKCAWIDTLSEIGMCMADHIQESLLRDVVKRLLTCRFEPAAPKRFNPVEVGAKAGRAIGKLVAIHQVHLNKRLMDLIFNEGFIHLEATFAGQPVSVRNQWAWALAELAQNIEYSVRLFGHRPTNAFLLTMLRYVVMVTGGHFKGRYNGFRAAGNLFTLIHPSEGNANEIREKVRMFELCEGLIQRLLGQLGVGTEYKNRWNAAFGLGCIFENEDLLDHLAGINDSRGTGALLNQVIQELAKWVRKSQNYKERIQCLVALAKIPSRKVLGGNLELVMARICQSVVSVPSEENEMREKFEMEVVLTLCAILSLAEPSDFDRIETALRPWLDSIRTLCTNVSVRVIGERVDVVIKGRDRLTAIRHELVNKASVIMQSTIDCLTGFIGDEADILENVVDVESQDFERFNVLNI